MGFFSEMVRSFKGQVLASQSWKDLFTSFFLGWQFRNDGGCFVEGTWKQSLLKVSGITLKYLLLCPWFGIAFDKKKIKIDCWNSLNGPQFYVFFFVPEFLELNKNILRYVILVLLVVTTPHGLMTLVSSQPMPLMARHAWKSWRRGRCATHPCRKQRSCRWHAMCLEDIGVSSACESLGCFVGGFIV